MTWHCFISFQVSDLQARLRDSESKAVHAQEMQAANHQHALELQAVRLETMVNKLQHQQSMIQTTISQQVGISSHLDVVMQSKLLWFKWCLVAACSVLRPHHCRVLCTWFGYYTSSFHKCSLMSMILLELVQFNVSNLSLYRFRLHNMTRLRDCFRACPWLLRPKPLN